MGDWIIHEYRKINVQILEQPLGLKKKIKSENFLKQS